MSWCQLRAFITTSSATATKGGEEKRRGEKEERRGGEERMGRRGEEERGEERIEGRRGGEERRAGR